MERPVIVAIDFDGILCKDAFPEIGKPNYEVISFVRRMQDSGVETVLWTSRVNDRLNEAVDWCVDYGLHFTAINDNTPNNISEYGTNPRKVFADLYLDDKTAEMLYDPTLNNLNNMLRYATHVLRVLGVRLNRR